MRRTLAVAVVALALPAGAAAKGPTEATVAGPGLDRPLVLRLGEDGAAGPLARLTERSGFWVAAFGVSGGGISRERPEGELGPRYVVEYRLGPEDVIRQDLYPYAEPVPVTYTSPDQRLFDRAGIRGGWYVAGPELRTVLVGAGLPVAPPPGSGPRWALDRSWPVGAAIVAALVLGAALALAALRRRAPAPAR